MSRQLGQQIEQLAEQFLVARGMTILERNYQIRGGELDLIAKDSDELVFVEVRFRHSADHGSAAESVTARKQQRLRRTAEHYLHHRFGSQPPFCRFDVLAASGDPVLFEWIRNAF